MEVKFSANEAKLYAKYYVARRDLGFARFCAETLLTRRLHHQPWEGSKSTAYQEQSAFTSALVIAYTRPFKKSNGWIFPFSLASADVSDTELHHRLIDLRDKVYAHSDSASYSIRPWEADDFRTVIEGAPALRLTVEEVKQFITITAKLLAAIDVELKALWPDS